MIRLFNILLIIMCVGLTQITQASEPGNNNTDFEYFEGVPTLLLNRIYDSSGNRLCMTYTKSDPGYVPFLETVNIGNLNDSIWSIQSVTAPDYGDNVFAITNKDGWYLQAGPLFDSYIAYLADLSSTSDISTVPTALWQININTTQEDVGFLFYSIMNCYYAKYLSATASSSVSSGLTPGLLTNTIESGSWWSALVSPTRLPAPILTNALVFNGDEENPGAVYLSITSDNVILTNDNDASTNLWLVNSSDDTIPNGYSLLIGNQSVDGSFDGISCLGYNQSDVYSAIYTTSGEESTVWSILPYRYQMYTIQTSDGRFLIRSTPQTVGLVSISDSINNHPEAIWNLLDSDINYSSDDQQTILDFLNSEADLTSLGGNPYTGDIYATEIGAPCTFETVTTEVFSELKLSESKLFIKESRYPGDSTFIDMLKRPERYGISFRKLKRSIIHAFDKVKKIAVTAVDEVTGTGTIAFIDSVVTPPILNSDIWSGLQRGINMFSQINEFTPLGDGILELAENGVFQITSIADKIFHSGRKHSKTKNKVSSEYISLSLKNNFKLKAPIFYSSNNNIIVGPSEDLPKGSTTSAVECYLTITDKQLNEFNKQAQKGLNNVTIPYNSYYDCNCMASALKAYSYKVSGKEANVPGNEGVCAYALGLLCCTVKNSTTGSNKHMNNYYIDKEGKFCIYEAQYSTTEDDISYITATDYSVL